MAIDYLPSAILCERLGVSRTALREALQQMNSVGITENRIGSGTFVKMLKLSNSANP